MKKLIFAAALLVMATASSAWAERIVIVHGAFQNAAAWNEVAELLRAAGNEVQLVDLPGRDAQGDMKNIGLADYRDATLAAIDSGATPVVLIGHSFGGFTISNAAEAAPEKIRKLVFVAAYVPKSGESMQSLAALDKNSKFTQQNFVVAADYTYAEVLKSDRGLIFANDGSPEIQLRVAEELIREPLKPVAEPVALAANYDAVPKAYVRTLRDNAVSTQLQDMLIARAGIAQVVSIDTGHAPSVTAPEILADAILQAAGG
jgi:pimeloyl-ACP methyl ester carboxylesterase